MEDRGRLLKVGLFDGGVDVITFRFVTDDFYLIGGFFEWSYYLQVIVLDGVRLYLRDLNGGATRIVVIYQVLFTVNSNVVRVFEGRLMDVDCE